MQINNTTPISSLGLAIDGKYYLNNSELIYLIDDSYDIVVDGNVKLIDITENKNINILGNKNSVINYFTIYGNNGTKNFNIKGELNYLEIAIKASKEIINIYLLEENAQALAKVLALADGMNSNFIENIEHKAPNTISNITNVGVSMNTSGIIFDTTGKIEKKMKNSKCSQLSRGIVMDNDSYITAKPILLIDEFDCFANHGASIGKMSDEDLFYLMSRGLSKNDAFLLILKGIINPFIDSLPFEELKSDILEKITNLIEK